MCQRDSGLPLLLTLIFLLETGGQGGVSKGEKKRKLSGTVLDAHYVSIWLCARGLTSVFSLTHHTLPEGSIIPQFKDKGGLPWWRSG